MNKFDLRKGVFTVKYEGRSKDGGSKSVAHPTEMFVPKLWCLSESDMTIIVWTECTMWKKASMVHSQILAC